jgi:hypothetical protein
MPVNPSAAAGFAAQLLDNNGVILTGGKIYTYVAGTTTPQTTYTDSLGITAHANPIILDSAGRVPGGEIWLTDGASYKFLIETSTGSLLGTYDNISGINDFSFVTGTISSANVSFLQAGTSAVTRTAQSKMRDTVSAKDFGAVGNGVADDTAALKAAFDYAMPLGLSVVLEGTYLVSDAISSVITWAAADMHIICQGDVAINVSGAATAFRGLLYCQSTAANNASITGGSLTIDANNKTGEVIYIRHYTASQGGQVSLLCPVTVLNAKQALNDTSETAGIAVLGEYASVVMIEPIVKNVSRINPAAACAGITVAGFSGDVTLYSPRVENILTAGTAGTPSGADADGIKVFGKGNGVSNARTEGRVVIYSPIIIDCQGRGFKSQCSDTTIFRPYTKRQMVVVIPSGHDFDFQKGNGLIIEPEFEYLLNGATPPLAPGNSFACIAFQQTITGFPMYAKCTGGVLKTECVVPNFGYALHDLGGSGTSGDSYAETEFTGLRVEQIGSFTGNVFDRCVIETTMNAIEAKTKETKLIVRDISGPFNTPALGYTSYTTGSLAAKLTIEITDIFATVDPPGAGRSRVFGNVSGNPITTIKSFIFRNINGLVAYADNGFPVDFRTLKAGCQFVAEIGDITQTNNPPWGTSGDALVECIADYFGKSPDQAFTRVTAGAGANPEDFFFTVDGGATWSSNATKAATAANIAAIGNVINTTNKVLGRQIYDTTNNRLMIASGANANSPWYVADGGTSVTPS